MVDVSVLVTINLFVAAYCQLSIPSCGDYCRALSSGVTVTWRPDCNCMAQGNTEIGFDYSPRIFSWLSTTPKTKPLPPIIYKDVKMIETFKVPETTEIKNAPIKYVPLDKANDEVNLNNIKFHEQDLGECIELYILKSSRNCNTTADPAGFKHNNLEDYINISDDELAQEFEDKCKEVSHLIESSLREIKDKWWSKIKQNGKNYPVDTLANKETKQKTILDGYTNNVSANPINKENGRQNLPNTENSDWLIPKYGIENFTNPSTPENKIINEPFTKYISNNDKLISPTPTPHIHYDDNQHTSQPVYYETVTVATEPSFDIKTSKYIESEQYTSNSVDNVDMNTSDRGPYQFEPNTLERQTTTTTSEDIKNDDIYSPEQLIKEGKPEDYTNEIKNNTSCLYEEDTPLVKIVSREYPNGTVSSEIQGTEQISDNEFIDNNPSTLITKLQTNNTIKKIYPHEVNSKENPKISGQLYFAHAGKQVPIRLIQEPDGNIRLGLEALTICEDICSCSCTNEN